MGITKDMIFGGKKTNEVKNSSEFTEETFPKKKSEIIQLEVSKTVAFREGQPFSSYSEEKMQQMKESIKRNGIVNPVIVRKIGNDMFEIIAGHNRVRCAKELDMLTVPAIILEVDDDNAKLIMLETNLCQRDDIPPVEKGVAYKMQLETIKRITEKQGTPLEHQKSIENLASNTEDSRATIQRLIRLTELIKPLQDKVNGNEQIPIRAGVELSYINKEEQEIINRVIEDNKLKLSTIQAELLREIKGTITEESVIQLFIPKSKEVEIKFTGKISKNTLKKYREKFKSNDEFDSLINKLLEEYFNKGEVE